MNKIKILLAEDELTLAMVLKDTLESQGYEICHCANGIEAWDSLKTFVPDICVVDIMMSRKDGISLVKDIRLVNEDIPVIFLTAKSQTADVIEGFKAGADDYLKKPFSIEELILRIKALIKRRWPVIIAKAELKLAEYVIGEFKLLLPKNDLVHKKNTIKLSQREAELLKLLIENRNDIVPRNDVLLKLWGETNFYNARNMDVYISKLRKHLEKDPSLEIINVRGVGYKLID